MARKKKTDELSELDQVYRSIAGKQAAPKRSSGATVLIVISCILLLAAIGGAVWFMFCDHWLKMPDVTVAGVNMQNMTRQEAKELLSQMVLEQYGTETMTVTVSNTTISLPASDAQVQINVDRAINYASRTHGEYDMTPFITINEDALANLLQKLDSLYNTELTPTTYEVEGTVPDLSTAEELQGQTLIITIGRPDLGLDIDRLRTSIYSAYSSCVFHVDGQITEIAPEIPTADSLYEQYLTAPVDAVMDMQTFDISREKYGYSVERTVSVVMEGLDGMEKMAELMKKVENNPIKKIGDTDISAFRNYNKDVRYDFETGKEEPIGFKPSNVLYFELSGGGFFIVRPSGTEPKIKFYYSVPCSSIEEGNEKIDKLDSEVKKMIL